MAAGLISGTEIARQIREEIRGEADRLRQRAGIVPGLVTILVGGDPASVSYVTAKQKAARDLGFFSLQESLQIGRASCRGRL